MSASGLSATEVELVRPPQDDSVRRRITDTDLDRTLFVEAGAGSGKTTQLVQRVVNLVTRHGVGLAQIAAITFTEAAASELRDRIRVELEQLAANSEALPLHRDRARQALSDADLAAITTLHGFAKRMLSEHPMAAGLPPRVDVLDEINSQLEAEARWERFVDGLYGSHEYDDLLERAALVDVVLEPRVQGQASLKDVASVLDDNWDRLGPLVGREHGPLGAVEFDAFDRSVAALAALLDECTDRDDKFFVHLEMSLLPEMRALVSLADPKRKLQLLAGRSRKPWTSGRGGKDGAWSGDVRAAKQRVDDVNQALGDVVGIAADEVLQRFLTLIAREVVGSARARQTAGALEFHDLLVLARDMVRSRAEARRSLHSRYSRLLLDEFQDTDPIQIELAVLIASTVQGQDQAFGRWSDAEVEEGRLFFVGDPKQSIYRFRRADISLFLAARDRFGRGDASLELSTNFRTLDRIVAWVNELFGSLMPTEVPGAQPRYRPLVAHRPSSGPRHRPVLFGGPHDKMTASELRVAEATDVADAIADVRDHPADWMVGDGSEQREAKLSDVTILVPTRTSLPQLREALEQRGIEYRLATGTLVYQTQEVRDLLAIVRAVDDPTDELSLVAALRSPFYACSDRDLLQWRSAGGRWDLTRTPPDELEPSHPVAEAMTSLRSLWADRWWIGPSALVERIYRERRGDLLAFADGRPADVWRRFRFVIDQARAFEDSGASGLRGFVDWAELQSADGARVHEPILPETDDDAVRIMTVHGAKGLEFPITILSGLTTKPGNARSGIRMMWGDDGLPSLSVRSGLATANHDPRLDLEAEMDDYEKLRLLYVACTRARDHLLVSTHHVPPAKATTRQTFAELIWTRMAESDCSQRPFWAPGSPPASNRVPMSVQPVRSQTPEVEAAVWRESRAEVVQWFAALAANGRRRVASATAIARDVRGAVDAASDLRVAREGSGETDEGLSVWDEDTERDAQLAGFGSDGAAATPVHRRGRRGTAIGTAVHAALEFVDLAHPVNIDALAERFASDNTIADASETVLAMAASALSSPAVHLAARSVHHKEVYVAAPIGDRVIEGYIDLLIETSEGLVVVDYKTDAVTESTVSAKVEHYELQGAAYALALEVSTGLAVIDCRFVFCQPGGAIERSVADLGAAKAAVRAYLGAPG